jgi:hypothetical protein
MAKRQPPLKVGASYDIEGPSEDVRLRLIGRATIEKRKKVLVFEVTDALREIGSIASPSWTVGRMSALNAAAPVRSTFCAKSRP